MSRRKPKYQPGHEPVRVGSVLFPRMVAEVGNDNPKLCHNGERCYFPHVQVLEPDPDTQMSEDGPHGRLVVNDGGNETNWLNPGMDDNDGFDLLAQLLAASPHLAALAVRVARLNRDAGEIGPGMLAQLVDQAREAVTLAGLKDQL